tara:strand:- start:1102 stop:1950 length:849 start_codon:yes stop_codon:yes gene_type:complete
MTDISRNGITATDTNTDLSLSGNGTGAVNLATGAKLNGTALTSTFIASGGSGSGAGLTDLNASNLGSGTVPDARFPATLPAVSGVNLTAFPTNVPNVAPGTSGNLLTSTGSAWASSAPAAGGAWAVTSSGTFSTTANLTVTGLTKTTSVILENVVISSDAGYTVNVKFSTDNGATMIATSTYDGVTGTLINSVNQPAFYIASGSQGAGTDEAFSCWFTVYGPNTAGGTYASWFQSGVNTAGTINGGAGVGNLRGNHAVNAVQFVAAGGVTLVSGSYTVLELN